MLTEIVWFPMCVSESFVTSISMTVSQVRDLSLQSSHLAEIKRVLPSFSISIVLRRVKWSIYHSTEAVDLLAMYNLDTCIFCLSIAGWQHGWYYRTMSLLPWALICVSSAAVHTRSTNKAFAWFSFCKLGEVCNSRTLFFLFFFFFWLSYSSSIHVISLEGFLWVYVKLG